MSNHEPALPPTENDLTVRTLIEQFRTRTLTLEDHALINAWLHNSEENVLRFEAWISQRPADMRPWREIIGEPSMEKATGPVAAERVSPAAMTRSEYFPASPGNATFPALPEIAALSSASEDPAGQDPVRSATHRHSGRVKSPQTNKARVARIAIVILIISAVLMLAVWLFI